MILFSIQSLKSSSGKFQPCGRSGAVWSQMPVHTVQLRILPHSLSSLSLLPDILIHLFFVFLPIALPPLPAHISLSSLLQFAPSDPSDSLICVFSIIHYWTWILNRNIRHVAVSYDEADRWLSCLLIFCTYEPGFRSAASLRHCQST